MKIPDKHRKETKRLVKKIPKKEIGQWLLSQGYYPEQYVLPPPFVVQQFELKKKPYYPLKPNRKFNPLLSNLICVSFPKSELTERTFGIIEPKIYHDLTWYILNDWEKVLDLLFHKQNRIVSYSFPIPVTRKTESNLGKLRVGRMIYEFIEMAENDLVAESYQYKYILKTDIKNFYPSIYTHSISWAIHTKEIAKKYRNDYSLLGNKLDRLCQQSNDGCTNGIAIGPAIPDLIAEIILSAVDIEVSKEIVKAKIDSLGVRFKDDYRFLCHSKADAEKIIKQLQIKMRMFNLALNESKSSVKELPVGLYRPWLADYQKCSLRYRKTVGYKKFELSLLAVLQIHDAYPETGVLDRFLSELSTKKHTLKLKLKKPKNVQKVFSLLMQVKRRRSKTFPQILAIIERLFVENKKEKEIVKQIKDHFNSLFYLKIKRPEENLYDLIWLAYFMKSNKLPKIRWPKKIKSELLTSLRDNNQAYFNDDPDINLFIKSGSLIPHKTIFDHIAVFPEE